MSEPSKLERLTQSRKTIWDRWSTDDGHKTIHSGGQVNALQLTELDGRPVLVSGGSDHTVRVWALHTGEAIGKPWVGHRGPVNALATGDLDGRPVVVSASEDGTFRIWYLRDGIYFAGFWVGDHSSVVRVLNPDGMQLVDLLSSAHHSSRAIQRDGTFPRRRFLSPVGINHVATVQVDDDLAALVSDKGGLVWIWRSSNPRQLDVHDWGGVVKSIAVTKVKGQPAVVSGSVRGSVDLWRVPRGELIRGRQTGRGSAEYDVAVNALTVTDLQDFPIAVGDFSVVVSGGADGRIRVSEPITGQIVGETWNGHQSAVNDIRFGELNGWPIVASCSDDGTIQIWDFAHHASKSSLTAREQFAQRLGHLRLSYGMYTSDIIGRLDVSRSAFWSWIHGDALPGREDLVRKLERVFKAKGADLLEGARIPVEGGHQGSVAKAERIGHRYTSLDPWAPKAVRHVCKLRSQRACPGGEAGRRAPHQGGHTVV